LNKLVYRTCYEYKYLITLKDYELLKGTFDLLATPDPNSTKDGSYIVTSEYFDTPDFTFYHQKLEGEMQHAKIRKRYYSLSAPEDKSKIFLEAKLKNSFLVFKHRTLMNNFEDQDINSNFFKRVIEEHDLRPSCKVMFDRKAYFLELEGEAKTRITFDSNIMALYPNETIGDFQIEERLLFQNDLVLMEVKPATPNFPLKLQNIIFNANVDRISFSKYFESLTKLNIL
jgi:hypothetical protein